MQDLKKIDVVFSVDRHYLQHFCVAVTSLLENSLDCVNRIFLISDIDDELALKKVSDFIFGKFKKKIDNLTINNDLEEFFISSHISKAAYFRLFLSQILPLNVDKVLYLDSDIIITRSIGRLAELNFSRFSSSYGNGVRRGSRGDNRELYLYAVNEIRFQDRERLISLGLSGLSYFDSGVLFINLRKWREDCVLDKLTAIALTHKLLLKFHDQDVLNMAFEGCWGMIDYSYNALNMEYLPKEDHSDDYFIVHYTGGSKPWHFKDSHPLKRLYWMYLWRTPYRFYLPRDISLKNIIKKVLVYLDLF